MTGAVPVAAYWHCRRIARRHYENFTIGSWLLPRSMRHHLAAIYAFARTADDFADEGTAPAAERLARLDAWECALDACLRGDADDPIFVALGHSIRTLDLPVDPFRRLLRAFRTDVAWRGFDTDVEMLTYCEDSANPVGQLVLALFGHRDAERRALSDRICTGLQLANFWQDLGVDLARGRCYVPRATLAQHGCDEAALGRPEPSPAVRRLLAGEVSRARTLLLEGTALATRVSPRLGREVRLFAAGGLAILGKITAADYTVVRARPTLSRREQARLVVDAAWGRRPPATPQVDEAYRYCREVTRRSASNFAWAFRLLAPERRAALEAVYAFCRFVDDVADDAGRRNPAALLARWREELGHVYEGTPTHPIGVALADAVRRFPLAREDFEGLIDGVAMDLTPRRFETFDELWTYSWHVAATVGLLCIAIFGARDPASRQYAVDLGVACQLTNILRDVREDAERGRIYLPLEDLRRFDVSEAALRAGRWSPQVGALMAFECGRARAYYLRARGSLPPADRLALAPAEAMRGIYERLLDRIEARHFDVFGAKVTVPRYQKVGVALAGWGRAHLRA